MRKVTKDGGGRSYEGRRKKRSLEGCKIREGRDGVKELGRTKKKDGTSWYTEEKQRKKVADATYVKREESTEVTEGEGRSGETKLEGEEARRRKGRKIRSINHER